MVATNGDLWEEKHGQHYRARVHSLNLFENCVTDRDDASYESLHAPRENAALEPDDHLPIEGRPFLHTSYLELQVIRVTITINRCFVMSPRILHSATN